jgi:L-alanine-DL-glutamate epimerase-like enolase superfamily enzyme
MALTRRRALLTGLAAALSATGQAGGSGMVVATPGADGLLRFADPTPVFPVDFLSLIANPVRIARIEMVELGRSDTQFVRVVSSDGLEGVVKANSRLEEVISLIDYAISPNLLGQDAREIGRLIDQIYRRQYKFAGLALWTGIGHLELAIWDMLGKTAGLRCVDMMGGPVRTEVPIYVSSLSRGPDIAREVAETQEALARTGARALKLKVGGRMSRNADAHPGRQEALVRAMRAAVGDDITIYADANGSFDAPTAINLCAMLEAYGVDNLEEPCPFEDFEMTAQVTHEVRRRGYKLKIAGGEQDGALERWRWYIGQRALDVLQPDFMYNGGMLRTLMVAQMAAAANIPVAPHYPRNGIETVELIHFACHIPNLYKFQEYRQRLRNLPFEHSPVIEPRGGMLGLPPGPGFGATYGAEIWRNGRRMNQVVTAPPR